MAIKYGRPLAGGPVELANDTIFQLHDQSVTYQDIQLEYSDTTGWIDQDQTGEAVGIIPFRDLHTRIYNDEATNPKVLLIHFKRTMRASTIGFGAYGGGDFSNISIDLLGSGEVERSVIDDSADNAKMTSKVYRFTEQLFNAIRIEFHTADPVTLSNLVIETEAGVSISQRDLTTDSLKTVNYAHAELHAGSHFFYREYHNLAKGGVYEHLIVTPDTTKWAHFTLGVEAISSAVVVEFFEDTTVSSVGTPDTVINRNRNITKVNTTLVYENPVVTADGNLVYDFWLGAGRNSDGGGSRDSSEIILKQNTRYLVRVTEQNVQETVVDIIMDWYEHTNKNTI